MRRSAISINAISVKRSVKIYREKGPKGFYAPRGAAVLVDSVVAEAEEFLAGGASDAEVAEKLGLKVNTLQKAIRAGGVRRPVKKTPRRRNSRQRDSCAPKDRANQRGLYRLD